MKSRTLVVTATLVAAAIALTGCSSSGSGKPAASGELTGTVTFWNAYSSDSPEVKTIDNTIIPAFEKLHPKVTVKDVEIPYDSLHQKLITAVAGDQLPDLLRSDIIWMPEFANLGVLAPLDTTLPGFKALAASTFPGALATNKWKGHYYGLPLDTNTRVMLYNSDVLAKAGIDSAPATMKDLIADAPKLKANGVYAYADSGTGGWGILPFIWSGGGQITDADNTKATGYMNSKKTVAVVKQFTDLYQGGYLPKIIVGDTGGVSTSDGTAKGLYATELDGPWAFPTFASQYPNFKVGTAQVPAGTGGSISVVGGEDIVLTKSSKNKPAAEAFLKYMLSDSAQLAMAKVGQMPVLSSLSSKLTAINSYYEPFTKQLKTSEPRTVTPAWTQIDGILQDAVRSAMIGKQTPQAAMDAAAALVDTLLAKYSK